MLRSKSVRPLARMAPSILLLGLLGLASIAGCKPKGDKSASQSAASASASSATASTGPGEACETYGRRLCDKAGSQSPTCEAIKTTLELLPPAACSAGLKDIEYSTAKLATGKKSCDELVKKLCDAVGPDTQTCQMVSSQTKEFPPERCKMMLDHLPEVVAELRKMEEGNQPLSKELRAAIVANPGAAFGPANAKVQIVEFSDFQCPFCSRAAEVVHQIKQKYGDRVRFVFRQFPLPMHPSAKDAAEAALAANSQGKFWEYHDLLFRNQQALDRPALEAHAKELGLNVTSFKKSLDDHKYASAVQADVDLGEKVKVEGTPTMFVNGKRVANPTSFEMVSQMIEAAASEPSPG